MGDALDTTGMVVTAQYDDGSTKDVTATDVSADLSSAGTKTVTVEPWENGEYFYYTLTGLTAVQMGDVVTAQLCMEKDGQTYLSKEDSYSIAQ